MFDIRVDKTAITAALRTVARTKADKLSEPVAEKVAEAARSNVGVESGKLKSSIGVVSGRGFAEVVSGFGAIDYAAAHHAINPYLDDAERETRIVGIYEEQVRAVFEDAGLEVR